MRRFSSRTRMYDSTLLHKFFVTPPIFPSEDKKKKRSQPTATRIMDHHLTLLELPCTPLPPSPLHEDYPFTEEHDLPVPLSASKTLDKGAINLEGGCFSTPSTPLNPPLLLIRTLENRDISIIKTIGNGPKVPIYMYIRKLTWKIRTL